MRISAGRWRGSPSKCGGGSGSLKPVEPTGAVRVIAAGQVIDSVAGS
jgi:hypothetical protein